MTSAIPRMVCGCLETHYEGCTLAEAETAAFAAVDAHPRDRIAAVLTSLVAAGLVRDPEEDLDEKVKGLLDTMFDLGLITS